MEINRFAYLVAPGELSLTEQDALNVSLLVAEKPSHAFARKFNESSMRQRRNNVRNDARLLVIEAWGT